MNIIFMGTPDFAIPTLNALYSSEHNVQAVFTQTDKPRGRGHKLMPSPVKSLALEHGTEVCQPQSLKNGGEEYIEKIEELDPDCIVVAAYGKILPKAVLDIPKYGCINIHGSLLPKYRGAAPIQRAVLNGEKETGVTVMQMAEGLDTGDMLLKESTRIGENETSAELFDRLAVIGSRLCLEALERIEKGSVTPTPQNDAESTYAKIITKDMCPIDFTKSVREIHNQIRGLSDYPCAYALLDGKRIKVYHSQIVAEKPTGKECGTLVDNKSFDVACTDGVIRFTEVQAENSKRISSEDYLRGKPLEIGTVFDKQNCFTA